MRTNSGPHIANVYLHVLYSYMNIAIFKCDVEYKSHVPTIIVT